jgi:hypothetical protein
MIAEKKKLIWSLVLLFILNLVLIWLLTGSPR